MPDGVLAELSVEQRRKRFEALLTGTGDTRTVFVAEDDAGKVVGFATCGASRGDDGTLTGELNSIYVLKEHQRSGIGRQLMLTSARELRSRGLKDMIVWVLAENPATRFYDGLGAKPALTKEIEIGGRKLREIGYGWDSLDSLVTALESSGQEKA